METNTYDNRKFMIFNVSEIDTINFDEVMETSKDTVRVSLDTTKTFVKWDGDIPPSVGNLQTSEGPFTYKEMLDILSSTEWTNNESIEWIQ
jgi:hypothetical protein